MIKKETWHREALTMEGELARLKKLLFQGAISEIEFAKAVMRVHGGGGLLEKDRQGNLRITSEWVTSHMEEVNRIQGTISSIIDILSTDGLSHSEENNLLVLEERDPGELAVLEVDGEGFVEDVGDAVSPLQNDLFHRWEWRDSSEYINAIDHLEVIAESFQLGAISLLASKGWEAISMRELAAHTLWTTPAKSEEEFNASLPLLIKMLEDGLQVLREASGNAQ